MMLCKWTETSFATHWPLIRFTGGRGIVSAVRKLDPQIKRISFARLLFQSSELNLVDRYKEHIDEIIDGMFYINASEDLTNWLNRYKRSDNSSAKQ